MDVPTWFRFEDIAPLELNVMERLENSKVVPEIILPAWLELKYPALLSTLEIPDVKVFELDINVELRKPEPLILDTALGFDEAPPPPNWVELVDLDTNTSNIPEEVPLAVLDPAVDVGKDPGLFDDCILVTPVLPDAVLEMPALLDDCAAVEIVLLNGKLSRTELLRG